MYCGSEALWSLCVYLVFLIPSRQLQYRRFWRDKMRDDVNLLKLSCISTPWSVPRKWFPTFCIHNSSHVNNSFPCVCFLLPLLVISSNNSIICNGMAPFLRISIMDKLLLPQKERKKRGGTGGGFMPRPSHPRAPSQSSQE
jgi:hypothetical protein